MRRFYRWVEVGAVPVSFVLVDAEGVLDWAERILLDSDAIDHWQKDRERIESEELLAHALGHDFDLDDDVPLKVQERFEKMVARRMTGEPTQLITGFSEFRGMKLIQRPGTFIPRDSSEFLAVQAIKKIRRRKSPIAVDLACGVGPVALAVKKAVPAAEVYGADLSSEAIRDARINARNLKVPVKFVCGDLLKPLPGRLRGLVDVVTIHPPYVGKKELKELPDEIRLFEPASVLTDGSKEGMGLVEVTVAQSPEWLRPGGWLLIEVSPDRARPVMSAMRRGGFKDVKSHVDKGFKVTRILAGHV
jgi:release factor glutamine methyltransferase